jgi:hypothetical protein
MTVKKLLILAAFALPLAACNAGQLGAPGNAANATVLDEQIGVGAETAYTTAAKLGTALATAGVIDKAAFKAADAKAYQALLATRAAYRAGNAASYQAAAAEVYTAVAQIRDLVK